eukprot:403362813
MQQQQKRKESSSGYQDSIGGQQSNNRRDFYSARDKGQAASNSFNQIENSDSNYFSSQSQILSQSKLNKNNDMSKYSQQQECHQSYVGQTNPNSQILSDQQIQRMALQTPQNNNKTQFGSSNTFMINHSYNHTNNNHGATKRGTITAGGNQNTMKSELSSDDNKSGHEDDYEHLSNHSMSKEHRGIIFISKNNLKLNVFLNMFLIVMVGLIAYFDWYCYKSSDADGVHSDKVCFKLMSIRVADQGLISIKNYVNQSCPTLPSYIPFRDSVCLSFMALYHGFFIYIILKLLAILLNIHSILSTLALVYDQKSEVPPSTKHRQSSNERADDLQNYNTFAYQPVKNSDYNPEDQTRLLNQGEDECDEFQQVNQKQSFQNNQQKYKQDPYNHHDYEDQKKNYSSSSASFIILEDMKGSLYKMRAKYDMYLTTNTMKWSIMINFIAVIQWLIFATALVNYQSIQVSPYLDLIYCFALFCLRLHLQQWENKLRIAQLMREYM